MCGIAGILSINNTAVNIADIKKMTDAIPHRGPDGEGHWMNGESKISFGHRRLSIIDLSNNAKQPMHYADGRYTITFNGEIYNYIELKNDLIKTGFKFVSDSDTEVLLALYQKKGIECLNDLDGMFAFAIWDDIDKTLFCARDRFGEKPFHYTLSNGNFIFASEIKQFWAIDVLKELKNERVQAFLYNGQVDNPEDTTETFYAGIKRLDAAHYILIQPNSNDIKQVKYWDIDLHQQYKGNINEASEEFLSLLTHSVKIRLRSDVPVGTSLSGGLDSSSIVMLIDKLKDNSLIQNSFSARFKNFEKDEGKFIEEVVKSCKSIDIHYTWPDKDYFESVLDRVCFMQDEPFGSASIVAQYAVMELAKKNNVTVLLDGQGADEVLAGYLPYYRLYLNSLFYNNYKAYKKELDAYNKLRSDNSIIAFEKTETLRMKAGRYRRKILNSDLPLQKNVLNTELKKDTLSVGLKALLRYADRNSMAHSREVRLPFLSHKLVEFAFSLPDHFKLQNGWTKYILRDAMKDILPPSITWRIDKIGYEPPQKGWMENMSQTVNTKLICDKYMINSKLIQDQGLTNDMKWKFLLMSKF